jgi:DNA-binding response OmpR family regulator
LHLGAILYEEDVRVHHQYHAYILVVVDDPDLRVLLADLLTFEGYTVLTAPNGQVALELATRYPPSLIVMDLQMPIMDGWTAIRKIRAHRLTTPIIILTAEPQPAEKLDGLPNVEYVAKPFLIDDFLGLIEDFNVPMTAGRETR